MKRPPRSAAPPATSAYDDRVVLGPPVHVRLERLSGDRSECADNGRFAGVLAARTQFHTGRAPRVRALARPPRWPSPSRCSLRTPGINGGERLRIGYVSANFKIPRRRYLISGLIEQHDRRGFEITGYSAAQTTASKRARAWVSAFDRFVDISGLASRDAAAIVHADAIDILVDLNGHTRGGRLAVFAYRPAPVQVGYLGHPATTGLDAIDYILVDPFVVPPNQQPFFTSAGAFARLLSVQRRQEANFRANAVARRMRVTGAGLCLLLLQQPSKISADLFDIGCDCLPRCPAACSGCSRIMSGPVLT